MCLYANYNSAACDSWSSDTRRAFTSKEKQAAGKGFDVDDVLRSILERGRFFHETPVNQVKVRDNHVRVLGHEEPKDFAVLLDPLVEHL